MPTEAQERVLRALRELGADGWPVSVREITARLGLASPSTAHGHLHMLEQEGLAKRHPRAGGRSTSAGWRATGTTYEAGLVREAGEAYNPTAVRWWVFADDDGFLFARGGREPTEQAAQSEMASARMQLDSERIAWRHRSTHELMGGSVVRRFTHELRPDGSLRPLTPSDFEVEG